MSLLRVYVLSFHAHFSILSNLQAL
jgi:hypothetical protein